MSEPAPDPRGVTPRAVGLGLALLPLNALWLVQMEMGRSGGPYPTTFSLFGNVVLLLAALVALNRWLRRRRSRFALSSAELLTLYVILCIGSALASVDFIDVLMAMLGYPARVANESNRWAQILLPYLPPGFAVRDPVALRGYYEGHSTLYTAAHLRAWRGPLVLWGTHIFVLLTAMLAAAVVVRRRWIEHERLPFPLLAIPLGMVDEGGGFWRAPLLWTGILLGGGVTLLNGLAHMVPALPRLNVKYRDVGPLFVTPPWNALGWTPVSFYPFAVGLAFLLPLDLLFSCWFFYLLFKVQRVGGAMLGLSGAIPRFPYVEEQCVGAYLAVALSALVTGRAAWRAILSPRGASEPAGAAERWGLGMFVAAFLALLGFYRWAGLPWHTAGGALLLYFLIALACARMRAELAPPAHDLHNAGPERLLTTIFGARAFKPRELAVLTSFYWFNRAYRSIPITHQLESFKLAERNRLPWPRMLLPLLAATVVGTLSAFWAHLHLGYQLGLQSKMAPHLYWFGHEAYGRLEQWLVNPQRPDVGSSLAILVGFLEALALQLGRLRWSGWVLHPLGLAVSGSYSMGTIWVPVLFSWAVKALLLRYGGIRAYRRAQPLFIGLVLGDYLVGCAWPLYGAMAGVPTYSFQQ